MTLGVPPGAQVAPNVPSIRASRAAAARPAKVSATAGAPRISRASTGAPCSCLDDAMATATASTLSATCGSRSDTRPRSSSASLRSRGKVSTTSRRMSVWSLWDVAHLGRVPLACSASVLAVAAGGADPGWTLTPSNETANMSCNTQGTRSAGSSVSELRALRGRWNLQQGFPSGRYLVSI